MCFNICYVHFYFLVTKTYEFVYVNFLTAAKYTSLDPRLYTNHTKHLFTGNCI